MKTENYEERLYLMTQQFTVKDIDKLIDSKVGAAGLLCLPVFAGMIGLGHVLYGFDLDDRDVFLKFAQYRMKISTDVAVLLYDNVRAGLIRQWCSHSHIILIADYELMLCGEIALARDEDNNVVVNAAALAEVYTTSVSLLPKYNKTKHHKEVYAFDQLRKQVDSVRSKLERERT